MPEIPRFAVVCLKRETVAGGGRWPDGHDGWGIWTNRNEVRHGILGEPASVLARWTKEYLENYVLANHSPRPYKESVEATWQPPKPPWYEANMDGAIFSQQKETGIGVVIRDHHKAVLGAIEVEAKAMEEAVNFTWDIGIRDCLFESDSLTVVNAMLCLTNPPSSIANIIAGSLSLPYKFQDVNFSHVVRSGNKAAHTLAQFARGVSDQNAWVEETPGCIEQLVSQDILFCLSMN